jgi:hypothetical protein
MTRNNPSRWIARFRRIRSPNEGLGGFDLMEFLAGLGWLD